jgi:phage shock protein PspC (stress-responsive transcriptional regulator)
MNKTFNINLGGYPFAIDEDAFEYVQTYLNKIRKHFSTSEGCDEIIYDIEARMAELFQEHLKGRSIVSMKEVDEIVMIMGKPEDFGAEPMDSSFDYHAQQSSSQRSKSQHQSSKYGTARRLFRDTEDKKIGGVCSGIAAYFGIEDPLWVRLGFAFSIMFMGIPFLLYILLWILVPPALSSSDKLAMRGEPATINNIAKMIETELNDLGQRINEWGNEINDEYGPDGKQFKKKSESQRMKTGSIARNVLANGVNFVGSIIGNIVPIFQGVVRPIFKIFAVLLLVMLIISWIASIFGLTYAAPAFDVLGPRQSFFTYSGMIGAFLLIGIPIIGLLLTVVRMTWKYRVHHYVTVGLWTTWIASIIMVSNTGMLVAKEFRTNYTSNQTSNYNITDDAVIISAFTENNNTRTGIHMGGLYIDPSNKKYTLDDAHIEIQKSPDNEVHVIKKIKSQGDNEKIAQANALSASNTYQQNGNRFVFNNRINFPADQKYRGQDIDYIVQVPVGKKVIIDENAKNLIRTNDVISWEQLYTHGVTEWTISNSGSSSSQYDNIVNFEKVFDVKPFKKLIVDEVNIDITKGSVYSVKVLGPKDLVEKVELKQIGEMVMIQPIEEDMNDNFEGLTIKMTVPNDLELIQVENVDLATVIGFSNNLNLVANADSDSELKVEGNLGNVNATIGGNQTISLLGMAELLNVKGDDGTIDADKFIVKNVNILGDIDDRSDFHVTELINLSGGQGEYEIIGNPKIVNKKEI